MRHIVKAVKDHVTVISLSFFNTRMYNVIEALQGRGIMTIGLIMLYPHTISCHYIVINTLCVIILHVTKEDFVS